MSNARSKASAKYNRENTKGYHFLFNKKTDKDIIEFLDNIPNKQGLIKELLRRVMYVQNN